MGPVACARDLLSKFYDIQGPVKEDLMEDLLKHIKEEADREEATKMLHGGEDARVEISELFQKFPSLEVDFATFVSYLDPLSGRL